MLRVIAFIVASQLAFADEFAEYWYAGKSEVAVYDLQQSRYGEVRPGTATLIFVTEPFSKKKHVKLDDPTTGKRDYKYQGFSYFESEGDESGTFKNTALAEELMLKIRLGKLDPSVEKLKLVLSQEVLRLLHLVPESVDASLSWAETNKTRTLTVNYENAMKFETVITYSKEFPYVIQSWSESFSKGGKRHTSSAKLKTVQMLPYWSMNSSRFDKVRKEIGLR